MDQQQVDTVGAKPQQRLLDRAHGAVVGIIDHGPVRLSADKPGPSLRLVKGIHPATSLGAKHHIVALHTPERRSTAMFRQAIAIVGRCIEQIDAELEGAACGSNRSLVVELKKEVAQRRGSESEDRSFKSGPAKGATR